MNKRQVVELFRQHFPELPIPTDLRKIRTRDIPFGPSEPFRDHQQLRTTAYWIALAPDGVTRQPARTGNVMSWDDLMRRLPKARMWPILIRNDCRHLRGLEYIEWYIKA